RRAPEPGIASIRSVANRGGGGAARGYADVGVLAGAAGLAVLAVGEDFVLGLLARHAVHVRTAPRIVRQRLLQVRLHRGETFLAGRVAPVVEAVLVHRLFQGVDLRARHLHLGLAHLREVARGYVSGKQSDDDDDDEQLEQREAFQFPVPHGSLPWLVVSGYWGIATGPSTGVVDVEVDAVVVVLVLPEPRPVTAPPSDAPETHRLDWPVTPNTIAPVPDWWAPTSGALVVSLKFARRCARPKPGLVGESW